MLSNLIQKTDGKKTYIFLIIWLIYKVGINQGWFPALPNLEVILLAGAGLSLRDGVAKTKK